MKKINYKNCLLTTCAIIGIASLSMNDLVYADNVDHTQTEMKVVLKRKILPEQLPGTNTSGSQFVTEGVSTPTIAKSTEKQNHYLPKTGTNFNDWSLWGSYLIGLFFLGKLVSGRKKRLNR
ncbi:hypothetical protein ACS4HS_002835 [Enterococcus hirae]